MITANRLAIVSPADGLIVNNTTLKTLFYYTTSTNSWSRLDSEANGRTNYKLIKSTDNLATVLAAELAAGNNTKYLLSSNTYYDINGTVNFFTYRFKQRRYFWIRN